MDSLPTPADVAHYRERGWWISPVLFSLAEIARGRDAMRRAYAGEFDRGDAWPYVPPINGDDPLAVKSLLWAWRVSDVLRDLVFDPRIVRIAAALMGVERVRIWQDQAIWKPGLGSTASDAGNIGWHQDFAYWRNSSTTNMLSANIALQDTSARNGALQVLDGSHAAGCIEDADGFFDTDLGKLAGFQARTGAREPTVLALRAGQVSFHHALTVHGSGPNHSDAPRMVVAPAYMPDGTRYVTSPTAECPHATFLGPSRCAGTPFAGDFFPLLPS